jgi:hypothetical protein
MKKLIFCAMLSCSFWDGVAAPSKIFKTPVDANAAVFFTEEVNEIGILNMLAVLRNLVNVTNQQQHMNFWNIKGEDKLDSINKEMEIKYGASGAAGFHKIIEFAQAVRDKNKLYEVAKYVGRIDIDTQDKEPKDTQDENPIKVGTGTLVQWDDMPERLKGRVVITCAHNIPDDPNEKYKFVDPNVQNIKKNYEHPAFNKITNEMYESSTRIDGEALQGRLFFTPDTGNDPNSLEVWEVGKSPRSIPVVRAYTFNSLTGGISGNLFDFAIFILEKPVDELGDGGYNLGKLEDVPDIELTEPFVHTAENNYFSIGYGRIMEVDDYKKPQKIATGWLLKKKSRPLGCTHYGTELERAFDLLGPSDSGSPIMQNADSKIVGIYTGGTDVPIHSVYRQMNDAVNHYVANNP